MKTLKLILGTSAVTLMAALTLAAQDGARGGAQRLSGAPASATEKGGAAASEPCGMVQDVKLDAALRGANREAKVVSSKSCPAHEAKFVTTGHGKGKVTKVEYTCRNAAVCCAGK